MRKIIWVVVCLLAPLSAYGSFIGNLGNVPPSVSDTRNNLAPGSYADYYNFTALTDITGATISFELDPSSTGIFQAGAFSIQLYAASTPAGSPIASGTFPGGAAGGGPVNVSFMADLTSNTTYTVYTLFSFGINGTGVTANATTSVSAIPLPAAAWLFSTGLIGLAGMARRKK